MARQKTNPLRRSPITEWRRYPWIYLLIALGSLAIQCVSVTREWLIYDRQALARGELWRLWTGHLVHFGWAHLFADAGLLLILGWPVGTRHQRFSRLAFILLPLFISGSLYWFDPAMQRYGGLSAFNFGLLLYLAVQGWQRNWTDWFWPAVMAIYLGEVIFEIYRGGQGGGMIAFDDPTIRVATSAHIAGGAYALIAWLVARNRARRTIN